MVLAVAVEGVREDAGGDDDAEEGGGILRRMILVTQMALVCG